MSLHAEWMFLLCSRHHVTSCRMDVFTLQEASCHFMQNGCFYSAGGIMSLHAVWMFLLCRRHHVTSCRMDVFTMQSVMHCIMSHVEWMFLHCVMYNGCFCLAGSGLGKRMAYRFVELGCDVALWDINGESLECMVQDFEGQVAVKAYTVDLASREQIYKVRVECQESRVKSQGCTVHTCILLQLARNCVCVCVLSLIHI